MLKYKCSVCGCKRLEVRYRYGYNNSYRYAICNDFGHGNRIEVPDYIPTDQIERYLIAKARV